MTPNDTTDPYAALRELVQGPAVGMLVSASTIRSLLADLDAARATVAKVEAVVARAENARHGCDREYCPLCLRIARESYKTIASFFAPPVPNTAADSSGGDAGVAK